ncbi:hypothetical protein EFO91_09850 [Lactiplantibacillus plantarum]|nr:hypothetical protein [Lactiplantibacillus plantarum]MCT3272458.1 hypothetical protein [Lactiplantibacillus plantarum]
MRLAFFDGAKRPSVKKYFQKAAVALRQSVFGYKRVNPMYKLNIINLIIKNLPATAGTVLICFGSGRGCVR